VAACLQNVRLAAQPENVPIAGGKNVFAGGLIRQSPENKLNLMPHFPRIEEMDWVAFEPTHDLSYHAQFIVSPVTFGKKFVQIPPVPFFLCTPCSVLL
jgi:hypothetical protein